MTTKPKPMEILVWNEHQKVPATVYGEANAGPGNYTIRVCPNRDAMDAAREANPSAIVYHFGGSSSGGIGHGH